MAELRELTRADWPAVLELNRDSVRELSELDEQRLEWLISLAHSAAGPFARMVCEVNVEPPNPASLAFHGARGYVELDRLAYGEHKLVALLAKELTAS